MRWVKRGILTPASARRRGLWRVSSEDEPPEASEEDEENETYKNKKKGVEGREEIINDADSFD